MYKKWNQTIKAPKEVNHKGLVLENLKEDKKTFFCLIIKMLV